MSLLPIILSVILSAVAIIGVLFWKLKSPGSGEIEALKLRLTEDAKTLQSAHEKVAVKEQQLTERVAEVAGLRATCDAATRRSA